MDGHCEARGAAPCTLDPAALAPAPAGGAGAGAGAGPDAALRARLPLLAGVPAGSLRRRVRALQRFNRGLEAALPLVDLSRHASRLSLAGAIRDARHLLFHATKVPPAPRPPHWPGGFSP